MKILTGLSATFDSLTKVIISLLGLGIVGLVAAIIILGFYK